ncbi:hypothetical protein N7499_001823 [Penicillium canescens]|nr:hypothetical protein N7499_001823 [Penicillium canescens]KAJ6165437.1 hypothetical protein N7485_008681 [Penicillium canescens]
MPPRAKGRGRGKGRAQAPPAPSPPRRSPTPSETESVISISDDDDEDEPSFSPAGRSDIAGTETPTPSSPTSRGITTISGLRRALTGGT